MNNIKSIKPIGKHQTFDLEVDHSDHQFYLANGVLTSNSHAVAYAIDSFWCAWLITYYEEQWVCSYLEAYSKTPEKRAKAFGEVKALGYQIVPIDINHAGIGWTVLPGKKLMPSMTSVKGVGSTAAEEIIERRPFESLEHMLYGDDGDWQLSKFNKKALESLIKVRAFDSLECVGENKLFKSYRHMHETLLGSYTEIVPKRKGSDEMIERVRDHSQLIKRSPKGDSWEGLKNLCELARKTVDEFKDEWDRRELAEFQTQAFGSADLTTMFDTDLFNKLQAKGVGSVEDLETGQTDLVWFITVAASSKKGAKPSTGTIKKTKNGKTYVQAFVTGMIGKPMRVNVWGGKELFEPFKLYVAEVKRDDFGLSTTAWKAKEVA
jgi:ribosomal protein S13